MTFFLRRHDHFLISLNILFFNLICLITSNHCHLMGCIGESVCVFAYIYIYVIYIYSQNVFSIYFFATGLMFILSDASELCETVGFFPSITLN